MLQFYLLSVLLNLLAGFYMFSSSRDTELHFSDMEDNFDSDESSEQDAEEENFFSRIFGVTSSNDGLFRLVVGCLSFFTALVKVFSPVGGVVIIGDLLPAAAGLSAAVSILLGYFVNSGISAEQIPPLVQKIFIDEQKIVGIGCIIVALLHFLFPAAPAL